MHITSLVVREFGLTDAREGVPYATINGVTVVDLQCAEGNFRIHLVRDSQATNVSLEEGSKLAAYYNSLFWHEATTALKIALSSGRFKTTFRVSDGPIRHSVFITTGHSGQSKETLGMPELEQVAREIATWHAVKSPSILREFNESVRENYENIRKYKRKIQKDLLELLGMAVSGEVAQYFLKPADVVGKVKVLVEHLEQQEPTDDEHQVVAHGRLTADHCKFDSDGKLVEITEWEDIHLGSPVEDLTNLIISSSDTEVRNKLFKKVFQVYLYALVDLHPPKYQLHDLKKWYREHWAKAVVNGIEHLLITLSEDNIPAESKTLAAHRWESSLNDAVDFLMGNYESDNQQDFFAHKD